MLLHPPRFSINGKCSDMKFGTDNIIDLDLDVSNGSAKGTLKPLLTKYGAIYEYSDPLPYAFSTSELGHDTVESNISRLKIFVGWSKAMKIFSCKI